MKLRDYVAAPDEAKPGNPNLPFGYLGGLVGFVGQSSEWTVLDYRKLGITYRDSDEQYLEEFRQWHAKHQGSDQKYVLFQYDVDARPEVTQALLKVHMEVGVPAIAMVFKQRIWDRTFKSEGRIEVDDSYVLDFGLLREFAQDVGSIGYHCNVWERSRFDLNRAKDLFVQDLDELRAELPISHFSMHGGPTDEQGRSNAQLDFSELANSQKVTWVHNGRSPSFHRNWDDGGAGHPEFRYRIGDVAEAIRVVTPGQRLRCLFHPQYYRCLHPSDINYKNQVGMKWFEELIERYSERTQQPEKKEQSQPLGKRAARKIWKLTAALRVARQIPTPSTESENAGAINEDSASRSGSDTEWFTDNYWPVEQSRKSEEDVLEAVARCWQASEPILINGMSRSGTTLLCGLFDVRDDTAMSYELYPNYVIGPGEQMERFVDYLEIAYLLRNSNGDEAYKLITEKGEQDTVRLMACANHSDLTTRDVGDVIFEFMRTPSGLYTYADALRFISALAHLKCVRTHKNRWGSKIQGQFEDYYALWPKARYIYIMRDGRDILASQLNNGNFQPDAIKLGNGWRFRAKRFEEFLSKSGAIGAVVQYEKLVTDPESTLRKLCSDLKLDFSENMLNHQSFDISLLHNPRGQLSADRVAVAIDNSAIGRWKEDLSPDLVSQFMEGAGTTMADWGYE